VHSRRGNESQVVALLGNKSARKTLLSWDGELNFPFLAKSMQVDILLGTEAGNVTNFVNSPKKFVGSPKNLSVFVRISYTICPTFGQSQHLFVIKPDSRLRISATKKIHKIYLSVMSSHHHHPHPPQSPPQS
jgi:hypothetical protein